MNIFLISLKFFGFHKKSLIFSCKFAIMSIWELCAVSKRKGMSPGAAADLREIRRMLPVHPETGIKEMRE